MPAEEISPIQGFKNGPNLVDFRPISAEKRLEEEKESAPLGAPESVTSSPPEETPLLRPSTESVLEEVAKMETQKLEKTPKMEVRKPEFTQGSQPPSLAPPASAEKDSTPTLPQPPVIKPGS